MLGRTFLRIAPIVIGSLLLLGAIYPGKKLQDGKSTGKSQEAFEIISIRRSLDSESLLQRWKDNGVDIQSMTFMSTLMIPFTDGANRMTKYGMSHIRNAPPWVMTEKYDIRAKVSDADLLRWQSQGVDKELAQRMFLAMLRDRCNLRFHMSPMPTQVYKLVLVKPGTEPGTSAHNVPSVSAVASPGGGFILPLIDGHGSAQFINMSMHSFAAYLSMDNPLDRPIVDTTGLLGTYTFDLIRNDIADTQALDSGMALTFRLDKLGLALRAGTVDVDTVVIDNLDRPTDN